MCAVTTSVLSVFGVPGRAAPSTGHSRNSPLDLDLFPFAWNPNPINQNAYNTHTRAPTRMLASTVALYVARTPHCSGTTHGARASSATEPAPPNTCILVRDRVTA